MKNEEVLIKYFKMLHDKLINEDFVIDKTGVKLVELIAPRIELDPTQKVLKFNGRKTPMKYVKKEIEWYDSMDLYVDEIGKSAKIWLDVCDDEKKINSNYGYLVYHPANYSQYDNCKNALVNDKETRRSIMIYNRPSMQYDYNKNGKSDFVCTLSHQFMIRNNKLESIVGLRSNDFFRGLFADFPWFSTIQERLLNDLQEVYPELEMGKMIYIPNSLHVYEEHFKKLSKVVKTEF